MSDTLPMVWPGSPNARADHPVESHQAADSITPKKAEASQRAVLEALRSSLTPLTDTEIVHLVNRERKLFSESRIRTARKELEEMGRVEQDGTIVPAGARTAHRTWRAVA